MFQAGAGGAAVLEVGLLPTRLEVVAMTSDVRLVSQPGSGVRNRQAGVRVFHLGFEISDVLMKVRGGLKRQP